MGNTKTKVSPSIRKNRQMHQNSNPQGERRLETKRALVRKKLLKSGLSLTPEELDEEVFALSDSERMKEKYFKSSVLQNMDKAVEAVVEEKGAHAQGIRSRADRQLCMEQIANEFDNIQNVEVRLVLYELDGNIVKKVASALHGMMKNVDYGPFHAAVVVGGVVLEWNNSSLVIPRPTAENEDWIFQGNVHQPALHSENHLMDLPLRAGAAVTGQHFDTIVEQLTNVKMEKQELINALVEVAVRYNTKFHYSLFSNNCQHFVRDCLHVLGITDKEELFDGRLKDHAAVLMKEGLTGASCENVSSHQDLDDYVEEKLETLNQSELELCLCHYLLFDAFYKASSKKAWQCQRSTCLRSTVEERLQDCKRIELK